MISPETEERIRAVLRALARERRLITYTDLEKEVPGAPSHRSPELYAALGDISEKAYRRDGIFLTALVVGANTGIPGEGFFTKMAFPTLGVESVPDWVSFWKEERDRVYEFYARHQKSN